MGPCEQGAPATGGDLRTIVTADKRGCDRVQILATLIADVVVVTAQERGQRGTGSPRVVAERLARQHRNELQHAYAVSG
jgi:hypothetical protein